MLPLKSPAKNWKNALISVIKGFMYQYINLLIDQTRIINKANLAKIKSRDCRVVFFKSDSWQSPVRDLQRS